jgi:diaminopimelate decarboxylase
MFDFKPEFISMLADLYGTPSYIFSEKKIKEQCQALKLAVNYPKTIFRYACKAASIHALLQIIKEEGYQIDASSYNEVLRALRAGFSTDQILYTGEGADELEFSSMLAQGIRINCSSLNQIELVARINRSAGISVRINPGEGHGHHDKVNTGGPHSKHGIYFNDLEEALKISRSTGLKIIGIHTHIGSGTDLSHWLRIKDLTLELARQLPDLTTVDLGGGLPVVYNQEAEEAMPLIAWGAALSESMSEFSKQLGKEITLELEPGRFLVAESASLIATVQGFKKTPEHEFVVVNSGFNHNPRPVLYGAFHPMKFITKNPTPGPKRKYVIAGNLCESGDVFTVDEDGRLTPREFPELHIGDLMQMGIVGAYSYSMMSEYNSMNLPAAILVKEDGTHKLIERRGNFDDLVRREVSI